MNVLPKYLKNKYTLAVFVLFVWLLFFDNYDLFSVIKYKKTLGNLKEEKKSILTEIETNEEALAELSSNPENLEKYAREKFLMKKENEVIYLIAEDQ